MIGMKKLNDVADIKLGLPFKKAINDVGDSGICYLIQTKDISLDDDIPFDRLAKVVPETSPIHHFLEQGDILLRLRGPYFSAAIIDRVMELPLITTNQVVVIRCNKKILNPYYLYWFLNSSHGQNILNQLSEGTNISKISLKIVSTIEWNIPTLEQQLSISNIQKNWSSQKVAYKRLIELNSIFFNELCSKINNGDFNVSK